MTSAATSGGAGLGAGSLAAGGAGVGARALERIRAVAADPRGEAMAAKERSGLSVVGYVDPYLPEELIMAHGHLPFRITVDGRDEVRSVEHIQSYACPAARSLLDQALSGDLGFLAGTLFTRYCDSLRGVFAVWDTERLTPFVGFVRYPTVTTTEAAVTYLAAELREVSDRLGEALGSRADDRSLWEAIDACARKRAVVADLARRRESRELALAGADYLAVLVASTTMLPDEFTALISQLIEDPPPGEPGDAVPVALSGTTFDNVALAARMEEAGLYLIADDLSTGSRWWSMAPPGPPPAGLGTGPSVSESTVASGDDGGGGATSVAGVDPWTALARAYLAKPPCSVKEPSSPRADHLIERVRRSGARGVVFYLTKFCDSEEVEWPYIRGRLEAEGIPSILIEGDHHTSGIAQVRTRLEAFRERLEMGDDFEGGDLGGDDGEVTA